MAWWKRQKRQERQKLMNLSWGLLTFLTILMFVGMYLIMRVSWIVFQDKINGPIPFNSRRTERKAQNTEKDTLQVDQREKNTL